MDDICHTPDCDVYDWVVLAAYVIMKSRDTTAEVIRSCCKIVIN